MWLWVFKKRMTANTDTQIPPAMGDTTLAHRGRGLLLTQLGLGMVVLSISIGFITLLILADLTPVSPTGRVVLTLEIVNAAMVVVMIGVISWQVVRLWLARRHGIAGARLHVRLVSLFSLVAAIPALVVIAFASVTLDRGLDAMFAKSTQAIVDNAFTVAESYIRSNFQEMRGGLLALTNALALPDVKKVYDTDKKAFPKLLGPLRRLSTFHAVYLVDEKGRVLVASLDRKRKQPPLPPAWTIRDAKAGKMSILSPNQADLVVGIYQLKNYENVFIYAYRFIDPKIVANLNNARIAKAEYLTLEGRRNELQITFALISISVSLVFLFAAIWIGLTVADRMVAPVVRLMDAARKVSRGIFDVKVPVKKSEGDFAALGNTFNKMTSQLRTQHAELIDANHMLTERRRFIEAVLSGVTSGVVGLDQKGKITLVNHSALSLLGLEEKDVLGKLLRNIAPFFIPVFKQAISKVDGFASDQVVFKTKENAEHNFVVRVMVEQHGRDVEYGYVLTFDDTTELVSAQRNSAWADIARRIAHEIKNPLTPIQLSAERLRRRFGDKIDDDSGIFEQCTETIIRQVGDIGRMVDEFSSFARMPKATLENTDLVDVVKQGVLLQRVGQSDIDFELDLPATPVEFEFDRRLISQVITNLVKNASEAIEARVDLDQNHKGRILVRLKQTASRIELDFIDNGIGLPKENRNRLVEPYMTTREKGTGLGLAIVVKIMEEHGGRLLLLDAPNLKAGQTGATVRLEFPVKKRKAVRPKRKATGSKSTKAKSVTHKPAAKSTKPKPPAKAE